MIEAPPADGRHKKSLEGFNMVNLTLSSDVDQDTNVFGPHERSLTHRCIISKCIHIYIYK